MLDQPSREHVRTLVQALGGKTLTDTERHEAFRAFRPMLITRAVHAESRGVSWWPEKPVKIGCCVLGHDGRGNFDDRSVGWNNTPRRLSEEEKRHFKPCGEKFAVLNCLSRRLIPIGMVVYTRHNQPDDITGLMRKVFCCCSNCTWWMKEINLPKYFFIESLRPRLETDPPSSNRFVSERYNLGSLIQMHEEALNQSKS